MGTRNKERFDNDVGQTFAGFLAGLKKTRSCGGRLMECHQLLSLSLPADHIAVRLTKLKTLTWNLSEVSEQNYKLP
jgi:hypothetical protein